MSFIDQEIRRNFVGKYERASKIFFNLAKVNTKDVTTVITASRKHWEAFKCMVKLIYISIYDMETKHLNAVLKENNRMTRHYFHRLRGYTYYIMKKRNFCPRLEKIYKICVYELGLAPWDEEWYLKNCPKSEQ